MFVLPVIMAAYDNTYVLQDHILSLYWLLCLCIDYIVFSRVCNMLIYIVISAPYLAARFGALKALAAILIHLIGQIRSGGPPCWICGLDLLFWISLLLDYAEVTCMLPSTCFWVSIFCDICLDIIMDFTDISYLRSSLDIPLDFQYIWYFIFWSWFSLVQGDSMWHVAAMLDYAYADRIILAIEFQL